MHEVTADISRWLQAGEPVVLATVVQTWGSAPRAAGGKMAVAAGDRLSGSVSGGCVEGAVAECAAQVLRDGRPQLLHFGVADETAWEVGLACGGTIDVFVQPLAPAMFEFVRAARENFQGAVRAIVVRSAAAGLLGSELLLREDGAQAGTLGAVLDAAALIEMQRALHGGKSKCVPIESAAGERIELFLDVLLPPATLIIIGGVHIAVPLCALAGTLGYRTVVVDPRRAFGSAERFPHVDRLLTAWPDAALATLGINTNTAIALLTHDPKLDDPGLLLALPSAAFYVGALGSPATNAKRRQRLLDAGLAPAVLDRLHAPIGLDLGGRSPEEIALSIMAQVVSARHARK
ncbi:MAG: XdhC family protein [Chloroflexi bacterium]|nr:XdhC family protein [Chloroflexota bacterium]